MYFSTLIAAVFLLATAAVHAQSSGSPSTVTFPSSTPECGPCQTAFSSVACQQVLASINNHHTPSVSNSTLAACQCTSTFLADYPKCITCFTQTQQLDLVFGQGTKQPPSLASLQAYCDLNAPSGGASVSTPTSTTSKPTKTSSGDIKPSSVLTAAASPRLASFDWVTLAVVAAAFGYALD